MFILFGANVLIILIAIFASAKFSALATEKGYPSRKAKKYPYFIAAGAFFFNLLGQTLLSFTSGELMTLLFYCWSGFVLMALSAILVKAYKNMKVAPDAKSIKP
jgi:hypothetical protein